MAWPGAAILCYHAVTASDCPSHSVANVPLEEITRSLEHLRRDREIVPLSELLQRHRSGRSIAGLAAVSFDDAYLSLGQRLVPWLRQHSVPCSIFVTNMATATGQRFWWDRVDDAFPNVSPQRWRAFENQVGLSQDYRDGQPREFGPLRPLRQFMLAQHKGRWPKHLVAALADVEQAAGVVTTQRPMTYTELEAIADWDGIEIGVHTHTHPVLPLLNDEDMLADMRQSFDDLRARFKRVIPVLAVPFGLFDARTLRLARQAGMMSSLTLANRLLDSQDDLAACPRLSMTRGTPLWKQRMRWSGVTGLVRSLINSGQSVSEEFPALPSSVS